MTMKTKESERLPLEMTEGKKKDDSPDHSSGLRARYDFLGFAKDTNIDGFTE